MMDPPPIRSKKPKTPRYRPPFLFLLFTPVVLFSVGSLFVHHGNMDTCQCSTGDRKSNLPPTVADDTHPGFPYFAPGCKASLSPWRDIAFDAPRYFPIHPFQMVLGTAEKPCTYIPENKCDAFSRGETEWPESFVIDTLIAMLGDCPLRKCHVLDLGGNMGYVNSYAAALGAKVVSVEPQHDLAEANRATTQHNCWQHRVTNLAGFVTLDKNEHNAGHSASHLWRPGMVDHKKTRQTTKLYLGEIISTLGSTDLDFVKIDVDSIDLEILNFLAKEIQAGKLSIHSIIIESRCDANIFLQLQKLGYHIFQLDHHMRARFFDARGLDVYKYRGSPIPFLDAIGEEYLCRRGMRQLLKYPPVASEEAASTQCQAFAKTPVRQHKAFASGVGSWLITKESLLQPNVMENWSKNIPPPTRGVYNNEKSGMPGEKLNPVPECIANIE